MVLTAAVTASIIAAATAVTTTTVAVSKGQSAKKRAASQAQQVERVRKEETKKAAALVTRGEGLEAKAKIKAGAIVAGKKAKRRSTLATGPRGLLDEPDVTKPGLLGS